MPMYNAAPFVIETLESIKQQTYSNWECLIVDDFCTDGSVELVENYCSSDRRFQLFKNNDKGIISALSLAYSKSKGQFIHRMDADDLMHKQKLEKLLDLLIKNGEGYVATSKVQYFSKEGVSDGYLKYQNWLNSLVDKDSHWDEIYKECVIASPAWLVSRKDLDLCDAFNPARYPEDYDLVFRFYEHDLKVCYTTETLHYWRDHPERTSRNDEKYASVSFFDLKLHYFLKLDRDKKRPLVIWGAGTKGKQMAKLLQKRNEPFHWVSNNANKTGKDIYSQTLEYYEHIATFNQPQIVVTVAQRNAKKEIIHFLTQLKLKEGVDYYFFR